MYTNLDPVISGKLSHFRRRWRTLILLRGLCLSLIFAFGLVLLLTMADWIFAPSDIVRLWLLGVAAVVAAALLVRAVMKTFLRAADLRDMAVLLEKARPDLREDLVAAVELSDVANGEKWDSAVFRQQLCTDVSRRMATVDIRRALPLEVIQRWWVSVLALLLVLGILAIIPMGRAHLLRAVAPGRINIGSASEAVFVVLLPAHPDNAFAQRGASLPVLIEVNGRVVKEHPHIQTDDGARNIEKVVMNLVEQGNATQGNATRRYASSVPMEADQIRYRFLAGRHQSKWYTVRIQDPPRVLGFIKDFKFPDYTGLPPAQKREEHGHVEILTGTEVTLLAGMDQEVKSAKLRHVQGSITNEVEMLATDAKSPKARSARFTVATNGVYSIHLIAAASGMANKPGEEYRIKALPDEKPEVAIQSPEGNIVRRPEDVLAIAALAHDDVAVKQVRQLIQIVSSTKTNAWTTNVLVLPKLPDANATIDIAMDLLGLDVKPGDRVLTRLVAVDVKGQTGESALLTLHIESAVFETRRIEALKPKAAVLQAARDLQDAVAELRKAIPDDLPGKQLGDLRQARDAAEKLPGKITTKAAAFTKALQAATAQARPGREAAEMSLLGHALARIEHEQLPLSRLQSAFDDATQETRDDRVREAVAAVAKLEALAGRLADNARLQLAADEAAVVLDHLDFLAQAQQLMNRVAGADAQRDADGWKRLARRQSAAVKDVMSVQQLLTNAAPHFDNVTAAELKSADAQLALARRLIELELKKPDANATLLPLSQKMQTAVVDIATTLRPIHRTALDAAATARQELEKDNGQAHRPLQLLRDRLADLEKAQATAKNAQGAALRLATARVTLAEDRVKHASTAAMALLRARAAGESGRADTDHLFVKDLMDTAQAAEHIAQSPKPPADQGAQVQAVADALRALEQAHHIVELESSLNTLSQMERWKQDATDMNTLRARDWQWHRELFGRLPLALRDVRLAGEAADLIEQAAASAEARAISDEMERRKKTPGTFAIEPPPK